MSAPGPVRAAVATRDDWETPRVIFHRLHQMFGFDLDAAANETNHKCERWLGPGGLVEDALSVNWAAFGQCIFVNPPYGDVAPWVKQMVAAASPYSTIGGATVVGLLPANTDTRARRRRGPGSSRS